MLVDGTLISDSNIIMSHIVSFYSTLLAAQPSSPLALCSNFWPASALISSDENLALFIPLSYAEIDEVVTASNSNSAPGPDGFSITFFKKFCPLLKGLVYSIIQGFCLGMVDISRLNYAILSLVPKVKGADSIHQFRPIALINNIAKFPSKGFAIRLSHVAHRVISPTQSAFIKGRFILDGIVGLHEIVHDLRVKSVRL